MISNSPHHGSSYISQLNSDWLLNINLYQEGILVSSNEIIATSTHSFVFESSEIPPVCGVSTYVPLPNLSMNDHKKDFGIVSLRQTLLIDKPFLWSAEQPYIYTLVISLYNCRDDILVQAESCRVGFRFVEINNGLLKVNHQPIIIRGANIHEHDPINGHSISPQLIEADVKLLKRNNFNAIRTSHYPHSPWLYELCSVYGLYVVDEANIETHGMKPYAGRLADDKDWEEAFMQRVIRMFYRDKVHPCIIGWSLGNESGYGLIHDKMASWIRKEDSTRVLFYEPASYGYRDELNGQRSQYYGKMATDVLCPMYARVDSAIKLANIFPDMPLIQCEYAHMMGNSGGNLDQYWTYFRKFPRLQGGFIWDWSDQGISVLDAQGNCKWVYGGDFGEINHDSNFCLNGLTWPDRGLGWARTSLNLLDRDKDNKEKDGKNSNSPINLASSSNKSGKTSVQNACKKDKGKWGSKKSMISGAVVDKSVYGLAGQSCNPTPSDGGPKITTLDCVINSSMSKPCLIEAKQCMKVFDCYAIGISAPTISMKSGSSDEYNSSTFQTNDVGLGLDSPPTSSSSSPASSKISGKPRLNLTKNCDELHSYSVRPSLLSPMGPIVKPTGSTEFDTYVRFSIMSHLDHIDDIQTFLSFDALLLCDGLVVDHSSMYTLSSGYVHRHQSSTNAGTGRHSIQEIEVEARFKLKLQDTSKLSFQPSPSLYCGIGANCNPVTVNNNSNNKIPTSNSNFSFTSASTFSIYGIPWQETTLLDVMSLGQLVQSISTTDTPSNYHHWTNVSLESNCALNNQWTVVVIGKLANHLPWASKGFPMGFNQINITKILTDTLAPISNKSRFQEKKISIEEKLIKQRYRHYENIIGEPIDISPKTKYKSIGMKRFENRVRASSRDNINIAAPLCDLTVKWDITSDMVNNHNPNIEFLCHIKNQNISNTNNTSSNNDDDIRVVISGTTGLPLSMNIGNVNFLADKLSNGGVLSSQYMPSRVQLHRAAIDNDRVGYLPRWEAQGIDSQMLYVENNNYKIENNKEYFKGDSLKVHYDIIENNYDLQFINVKRIESSDLYEEGSVSIQCTFDMRPANVNRLQLNMIQQIQNFYEDQSLTYIVIKPNSYEEEVHAHELAGIFLLGHESLLYGAEDKPKNK